MESEVAKPLRILSAYLMTAAMTKPPSACGKRKKMSWSLSGQFLLYQSWNDGGMYL